MREMLSPTGAIMGRGLGEKVALITDGRFSGGSHGFVVGHTMPEPGNEWQKVSILSLSRVVSLPSSG